MELTICITNVYVDGEEITDTLTVDVPELEPGEDRDDWADMHLRPFTGNGRGGDAGYFVEILDCHDNPELAGAEFEWIG